MSENRWTILSQTYAEHRDAVSDEAMIAARLARNLQFQLQQYLGGSDGSVVLYDLDVGLDGLPDKYNRCDDPFSAVSRDQNFVWHFGLGITLERSVGAWPKTNYQFPVWITWGNVIHIETCFGKVDINWPDEAPIDFSPVCELIYQGMLEALRRETFKTEKKAKIGFHQTEISK